MQSPHDKASFDHAALLANVDNDLTLLREMADLLLEDAPRLLEKLREEIEELDSEATWKTAHALKGALSNFATGPAKVLAEDIETIGRSGSFEGLDRKMADLDKELERLLRDLSAFVL